MDQPGFIDYYEVLELDRSASADTISAVYRHLAQRYHPDNRETGDRERFDLLVNAYQALKTPEKRAEYDVLYDDHIGGQGQGHAGAEPSVVARDIEIQSRLLSILYLQRRRDTHNPGVPDFELERLFECPIEDLAFHLWYLKEKRWIGPAGNGMLSITIEGVDHMNSEHHRKVAAKLLTDQHQE